ncbi:MAG: DUF5763 domain-containing protein, partial [Chloroflexota bacterium]|nr:DUF5763 domain-containing protein [Chloroflexota bacterium]
MTDKHPQPPDFTCKAPRSDGTPCKAAPTQSGYCWAHDPELRAKAMDARRRGGANRANTVRAAKRIPRDMSDLVKRLLEAIDAVERGDLDHRRATAMASLAGAACRVHEVGEMEQRLAELEERAAQQVRPGVARYTRTGWRSPGHGWRGSARQLAGSASGQRAPVPAE